MPLYKCKLGCFVGVGKLTMLMLLLPVSSAPGVIMSGLYGHIPVFLKAEQMFSSVKAMR